MSACAILSPIFTVHIRLADRDLRPFARFHLRSVVRLHCRPVWRRDQYSAAGWGMAMVRRPLAGWGRPIAYEQWPFRRSSIFLCCLLTVQP